MPLCDVIGSQKGKERSSRSQARIGTYEPIRELKN